MPRDRLIRHAAAGLIVFLGTGYTLLNFPTGREDTRRLLDFSEFYAAGNIVRHGLGNSLYDLRIQAEFQLRVAPVHAFYLRPPFEALLFVPFTYLSYKTAYAAWVLLSLALLAMAAKVIQRNTNIISAMSQYARGIPIDFGLLLVVFLTFAPVMNCFLIGQDAVLMLMVYTLVYLALKQQRELQAGGILACGLFKFHLVLPFAIIFALRRRGRFLLGFAAGALLLASVSVWVSGLDAISVYPRMFFNNSTRTLMGFQPEYAANLRGFIYLVGTGKLPGPLSAAIVAILSAIVLWLTAKKWNERSFDLSFSAAVIAAVLTGFHAFIYDLSLLLLPVAIVCGELAKRKALLGDLTLNTCLLVLFIPPLHHLLIVYHVYAVMCVVLVVMLVHLLRVATHHSPEASAQLL